MSIPSEATGPMPLSLFRTVWLRRRDRRRPADTAFAALLRDRWAVAGLALLGALGALAFAARWLYPGDPLSPVAEALIPPGRSLAHPLGTDSLGRDIAAGIAHGARVSLSIGILAATVSVALGTAIGALAGYCGGWIDGLLMRVTELFQTTPSFLLAIVIVTLGGPSIGMIVTAIGIGAFPTTARLVRAEFRVLKESDFVTAARSQGYGDLRIVWQEILPNALPPVIVTASVLVASAILTESGLSFLGLGDPNAPSWGKMIGNGREMLQSAAYLTAIPGGMIIATILGLNLVGDGLTDALNPRLRSFR